MQVTFLGTAGSWPTRERSASAVAVEVEGEVLLLDCGEGTQRQFFQSPLSFMRVRQVFLSHLHGDHILGLPGLIQTMGLNQRTEPLDVYGPAETRRLVESILTLGRFTPKFPVRGHELSPGSVTEFPGGTVVCAEALHSVPALAYRVQEHPRRGRFDGERARGMGVRGPEFSRLERGESVTTRTGVTVTPEMVMGPPRPGSSLVYSGDTSRCEEVTRLAQGADVLVHEATYLEELADLARERRHATARQAAQVAEAAGVGQLFLTHFSSRYADLAPLEAEARAVFPAARAAQDLLTYRLPVP